MTPVIAESDPFGLVGFCETASMGSLRMQHTETLLVDGRVLLAGGYSVPGFPSMLLATAEIYDPFTDTVSLVPGGMTTVRGAHTATLLTDGRVLITGGTVSGGIITRFAEIYDPVTDSVGGTGSMAEGRSGHTATLLSDGKVLIVGGTATGLGDHDILVHLGDLGQQTVEVADLHLDRVLDVLFQVVQ